LTKKINELSKELLGRYVEKAKRDIVNGALGDGNSAGPYPGSYHRYAHRNKGIDDAVTRLSTYIVKTCDEEPMKENEQLAELSKMLIGRYLKKSKRDLVAASHGNGKGVTHKGDYHRYAHRSKGIDNAVDKLTKEENKQDLLSAAYEAKPIEFNAVFNDKIIDRIGALVNAKRVQMAHDYWSNEPEVQDEAFNPGGHKGKLHRELGIATDKKIPAKRLNAAAHSSDREERDDAIRAKTMKKWGKK
jgi:hypothetical protein